MDARGTGRSAARLSCLAGLLALPLTACTGLTNNNVELSGLEADYAGIQETLLEEATAGSDAPEAGTLAGNAIDTTTIPQSRDEGATSGTDTEAEAATSAPVELVPSTSEDASRFDTNNIEKPRAKPNQNSRTNR